MNSCWRCGKTTIEGQIECEDCCTTTITHSTVSYVLIDWTKIQSFDDLAKVMSVVGFRVQVGSKEWETLREFLAD